MSKLRYRNFKICKTPLGPKITFRYELTKEDEDKLVLKFKDDVKGYYDFWAYDIRQKYMSQSRENEYKGIVYLNYSVRDEIDKKIENREEYYIYCASEGYCHCKELPFELTYYVYSDDGEKQTDYLDIKYYARFNDLDNCIDVIVEPSKKVFDIETYDYDTTDLEADKEMIYYNGVIRFKNDVIQWDLNKSRYYFVGDSKTIDITDFEEVKNSLKQSIENEQNKKRD